MAADIQGAAAAYVTGLSAIDACYPDTARAAALAAPHPGPDRDTAMAAIESRWAHLTTPVPDSSGRYGTAVGA